MRYINSRLTYLLTNSKSTLFGYSVVTPVFYGAYNDLCLCSCFYGFYYSLLAMWRIKIYKVT